MKIEIEITEAENGDVVTAKLGVKSWVYVSSGFYSTASEVERAARAAFTYAQKQKPVTSDFVSDVSDNTKSVTDGEDYL